MGRILIGAIALGAVLSLPAIPSAFAEEMTMDSDATQKLVNGNTAVGKGIIAFYDPDGTVRARNNEGYYSGRWWVSQGGKHCVHWEGDPLEACLGISQGSPNRYMVIDEGRVVGDFSMIPGNPHGL
ncbi:hypothetical protein [Magnetospira sp. QH-2]|uniref:hypothetical protein n=1 Tax=Magnetospira sp. (strain QH-2) TaxID=1288970 RepID=UPI0003E8162C|nr:hypothetical protein [Magnetospira sp. QH-2]CCQ72042.1 conserved protein of unknown function [Magnetospira sp. QH-2]